MAKQRVHEIAKALGLESKKVIAALKKAGCRGQDRGLQRRAAGRPEGARGRRCPAEEGAGRKHRRSPAGKPKPKPVRAPAPTGSGAAAPRASRKAGAESGAAQRSAAAS